MTPGDEYRVKAAELHAKARREPNLLIRAEFESLARSYIRLAEQANRNARTDVVYEPRLAQRPQVQQQQQAQPEPDKEE